MYQIILVVKKNKRDEFIECMLSLLEEFRKEKGLLDVSFYRNIEKEDSYIMTGAWKSRKARDNHIKNRYFSVLIGAARVIAETYEMNIGEMSET
jgi:quinol monooxygenase YgiN